MIKRSHISLDRYAMVPRFVYIKTCTPRIYPIDNYHFTGMNITGILLSIEDRIE